MKNYIVLLFALLFLFSCEQKTKRDTVIEPVVIPQNPISVVKEELEVKTIENSTINRDSINNFLETPFDLLEFKKKKRCSLSGAAAFKYYHLKPNYTGVGYRFFMFEPKSTNYIVNGREMRHSKVGYIGHSEKNISLKENGLVISTFQPDDKFQHKFLNPNEILIELTAKYNDFDLPELAFVGVDSISIIRKLGNPDLVRNNNIVYLHNNKVLILSLKKHKVKWLKWIHLNNEINIHTNEDFFEND